MSTSYGKIIEDLSRRDEALDREAMSRESQPSPVALYPAAASALVRSGGGAPEEFAFTEAPFSPGFSIDNLPADIADGIKAAYVFFNLFEKPCPGEYRDFALALMALTRLRGEDYEPLPDSQIAALMNLSRETVREKREGFFDWQDKSDLGLIDFRPQGRDSATLKFKPNLYRVRLVGYVASFVRVAREGLGGNPRFLIENSVEAGLKELHDQVCSDIPNTEIVRRAKQRRARGRAPAATKTARLREREDRLVDLFDRWCAEHAEDLRPALEILYERMNRVVEKYMGGGET